MMRRNLHGSILPALLIGAAFCLPLPATAAQVVAMTLDEIVDACDVAVWGQVTAVYSERVADAPGRLHTVVVVTPYEIMASDAEQHSLDNVRFSVPGGTNGRFAQIVMGAPKYVVGQEVVVMASRQPKSRLLKIIGLSLGSYVVEQLPTLSIPGPTAVSDRQGLGIIRRSPMGHAEEAKNLLVDRRPLDELLDTIRARTTLRSGR